MKVMIVDDEEMIRLGIAKILSKLKLDLEVIGSFHNGAVAWDHYEEMRQQGLDVVITDIKMPFMDGLKLIERMREAGSDAAVIILSGFEEFEYARTAIRFGVRDYLLKPIDKDQLHKVLQDIADTRPKAMVSGTEADEPMKDREHHAVEMIKEVLEQSYEQPFELEKLAQSVGMNGNYLSRLFKSKTNMTITDYVIHLRIEKAKVLLSSDPSLRNYEIAQLVGYNDPVYFNKLFKKMVGVTPKDYKGRRWPGAE